ncbi:hypothetical protein H6P81_006932 [Aristolochia fimbriata]|uniref:Uncharacterized protein n=1 Tax=Aristolochia fimbriata TaxID=158543 RepID=A0AAV7EYZ2_ARIFI|nr:hypothetical protein H6P81_006932 [Aristolochia fimbriata]
MHLFPRPRQLLEAAAAPHRGNALRELNRRYSELLNQVDAEKKRKERVDKAFKEAAAPEIEKLGMQELEVYKAALGELKKKVTRRAEVLAAMGTSTARTSTGTHTMMAFSSASSYFGMSTATSTINISAMSPVVLPPVLSPVLPPLPPLPPITSLPALPPLPPLPNSMISSIHNIPSLVPTLTYSRRMIPKEEKFDDFGSFY